MQCAHNCVIGEDCALAAMVGLSGSTIIGNRVTMGGQSATAGHLEIGDDVVIGGQAGVTKSTPAHSQVMGTPAIDLACWKRIHVLLSKFPEFVDKLKEIEKKLDKLSKDEN